ncbi:MAG: efflux RND transporter periplasmic adaptor subunit, partial [Gammaproteobacteria bacterium]|nr:efflux RND transporter periplasmic adaptor subunit [Gammaproteobacteria bacterium]NDA44214.1 efflux RND transporter periplasmic adaptor subunit [Gammaproteobacteria bacterium]
MKTSLIAITSLVVLGLLGGCSKDVVDASAKPGTPVNVAVASSGPPLAVIETNGLVGSRDEMRLSFKTGGIVRRIAVQEGETVRK